jgi:hypothetical protein
MAKKVSKTQVKLPKTSPEFERAVKTLANTKPVGNKELIEWNKKNKKTSK